MDNNTQKSNISAVLLAAGLSERFKYPKPLLPFDSEHTFASVCVNAFRDFGCSSIIVVLNESLKGRRELNEFKSNASVVYNPSPELGRFYSVHLAARTVNKDHWCFIHNVDSPFINTALLEKLFEHRRKNMYTVPQYGSKGGHPILISPEILSRIVKQEDLSINIKEILSGFKRINVPVDDEKVLANINTIEDYKKFFKVNPQGRMNDLELDQ